ncbi:LolA family protein [Streptomyces sp. DT24]|uniref:LolA family protein n=1 Tax=Streptomyces sp. DT24 TaxID=3416520 RepID=UPI003CF0CF1C
MAPNDSVETTATATDRAADTVTGPVRTRRKAVRYVVPVAVAGVAAATIGLVPALADSGDPELPTISAQELVEKIAASDTQRLSGMVKVSTDLGIPSLDGLAGGLLQGGAGSGGDGSSAAPDAKLTELASGTHTLRIAADGPDRQRVSILEKTGEYSLIHNAGQVWAYDSGSNEAYHATAPTADRAGGAGHGGKHAVPDGVPTTPKAFAEQALKAADDTTSVTVDGTARVAGRDAYRLVIKPKGSGSTIGAIRVAVDAKTGTPLKFTLSASDGGKAAVDVGFTKVDFGKPDASQFTFTPPKGAKVTEADGPKTGRQNDKADEKAVGKALKDLTGLGGGDLTNGQGLKVVGEGWTSVAEITAPGVEGLAGATSDDVPAEAGQFLDALGDHVNGTFGSGTVFKTRLVNALVTDGGKVYVGAVTKDALVRAADEAR